MPTMTSTKPYFLRAVYEWIVDNNCTPHLLVETSTGGCVVPQQHVKDGVIVLNVSPTAVRNFVIGNELVSFGARFGGVAQEVSVPITCVRAIYGKENGQGLAFDEEAGAPDAAPNSPTDGQPKVEKKSPRLTIVK
jgi:stringent starvation protein B